MSVCSSAQYDPRRIYCDPPFRPASDKQPAPPINLI